MHIYLSEGKVNCCFLPRPPAGYATPRHDSIHEIVSHLTYTHLVLEGPMVAMNRQLSVDHPINTLLRPHLEGTAFINLEAQEVTT